VHHCFGSAILADVASCLDIERAALAEDLFARTVGFTPHANDRRKIRPCKKKEAGRQTTSGLRA
jgi:hypothetical protein